MNFIFPLFTILLAAFATWAVPQAGPSIVPSCAFVCPPTNMVNSPLISSLEANSGGLVCIYGTGLPCIYNKDGKKVVAEPPCLSQATQSCTPLGRRGALPYSPFPPSAAARSPKPDVMKFRSQLKKRRG